MYLSQTYQEGNGQMITPITRQELESIIAEKPDANELLADIDEMTDEEVAECCAIVAGLVFIGELENDSQLELEI